MEAVRIVAAFFLIVSATELHATITFDWATIGNPGNLGEVQPGGTFGAVDYTFRISKHEVTNAQYAKFLNLADPSGANDRSLYNPEMSSHPSGGINLDGSADEGSRYEIKPGRENNPVVFVSMFDIIRFTNWLENGQGNGDTETGTYTITDGKSETRAPGAAYFLPSEDEWYKAAYHKNDGPTGNYWDYPSSSDTIPYSDQPPGLDAPDPTNVANMFVDDGLDNGYNDGAAVNGLPFSVPGQNYLTDVGAYAQSVSPYGTFDQGGNVWELMEVAAGAASPLVSRGGAAGSAPGTAGAHFRLAASNPLLTETYNGGFRVATIIPEPTSQLLTLLACIGAWLFRNRDRRV